MLAKGVLPSSGRVCLGIALAHSGSSLSLSSIWLDAYGAAPFARRKSDASEDGVVRNESLFSFVKHAPQRGMNTKKCLKKERIQGDTEHSSKEQRERAGGVRKLFFFPACLTHGAAAASGMGAVGNEEVRKHTRDKATTALGAPPLGAVAEWFSS